MNRVAGFVDAGYLFAQGSTLLAKKKLPRSQSTLNHSAFVELFSDFARSLSGPNAELLRIYWYDGTSTGPTTQHLTMAHLANVKLRLGFVNSFGQQKGVDSLIVTDMINLARNRAITDAVLLSGDEDLRVGVQQAQEFGIRVHLVGIKPSRGSQSLFLMQESDTTHEWDEAQVGQFLECNTLAPKPVDDPVVAVPAAVPMVPEAVPAVVVVVQAEPPLPAQETPALGPLDDPLTLTAAEIAQDLSVEDKASVIELFDSTKMILMSVDRRLLGRSKERLGRQLNSEEKKNLRRAFIQLCRDALPKA